MKISASYVKQIGEMLIIILEIVLFHLMLSVIVKYEMHGYKGSM